MPCRHPRGVTPQQCGVPICPRRLDVRRGTTRDSLATDYRIAGSPWREETVIAPGCGRSLNVCGDIQLSASVCRSNVRAGDPAMSLLSWVSPLATTVRHGTTRGSLLSSELPVDPPPRDRRAQLGYSGQSSRLLFGGEPL